MTEDVKGIFRALAVSNRSRWHEVILVNAQSVYQDIAVEGRVASLREVADECPRLMPPFQAMWVEFVGWRDMRFAVYFERLIEEQDGRTSVFIASVRETFNGLSVFGEMSAIGRLHRESPGSSVEWVIGREWEEEAFQERGDRASWCLWAIFTGLHSVSRMNCSNVELRAIPSGKQKQRRNPSIVPATVWHEIKISSTPKVRTTGKNALERDEATMRSFLTRGHYADYSRGPGLFGNPKLRGVFWIPEHRKGSEELGQVIPEYIIE